MSRMPTRAIIAPVSIWTHQRRFLGQRPLHLMFQQMV